MRMEEEIRKCLDRTEQMLFEAIEFGEEESLKGYVNALEWVLNDKEAK